MKHMTRANKAAWDGLAETHYRNYHTDRLLAGDPLLNDVIRREVGESALGPAAESHPGAFMVDQQPDASFVRSLASTCGEYLEGLEPKLVRTALLRFQGYEVTEIAELMCGSTVSWRSSPV